MGKIKNAIRRSLQSTRNTFRILKKNKYLLFVSLEGFLLDETKMYPDFKKNKSLFLTHRERLRINRINNPNTALFFQLNSFYVFRNFVEYARIYGVYANGTFTSYDEKIKSLDDVLKLDKIVFKSVSGGRGVAVFIISRISNDLYMLKGEACDSKTVKSFIESKKVYVFQEFVKQHATINNLYSGSLNTMRLITIRNDNEINAPIAVLRVGSKKSGNVDNFSAGGISCAVDMNTGQISGARSFDKKNKKVIIYEEHPDSKTSFLNISIPHFFEIIESLINAHRSLVELKFIAWDVGITESGYKIIEVNKSSDVDLLQIHGPLLKNKELCDFFIKEDVIKRRKLKR